MNLDRETNLKVKQGLEIYTDFFHTSEYSLRKSHLIDMWRRREIECDAIFLVSCFFYKSKGAIVPALIIFGDSIVDAGNNNNLLSIVKSDFPPYGRDFINQTATGRFCNGKLSMDFTAEYLGFPSYPLPILSRQATNESLLTGANFASASSGYYDATSVPFGAISLTRQLNYYKTYQNRVTSMIGRERERRR